MTTTKQTATRTDAQYLWAYVLPFGIFMAGLGLISLVQSFAPESGGALWLREPKYWVFPLQAVLCGVLLIYFWKRYEWGKHWHVLAGIFTGLVVLGLWISPQWLFGAAPRVEGFDPSVVGESGAMWWGTIILRFLRLVVVVPLLEEIFWRGFLLRYLIREDFTKVPLGSFSWFSFITVVVMFGFAHWGADFIPALATGIIYNFLMIRTRSLTSCVIAHAVTNLGLGIYIMQTGQWGFW